MDGKRCSGMMFGYIKIPLKIMYKDLFDICSNPSRRVAEYVEDDYVEDPSRVLPSGCLAVAGPVE
jgi:hypothetical protein